MKSVKPLQNESRLDARLANARPLYFLPHDNLAEEVLIPGFQSALTAKCMVGFFSSAVLADLAPGLASYINGTNDSFRIIVSPFLTDNDRRALETGLKEPEKVAEDFLKTGLVSTDDLQKHTLRCLSYLLRTGKIEFKIALMKDALFHPKVWIFETAGGTLVAHGSSNMTKSGILKNKEQIAISQSWGDPSQKYVVSKLDEEFERLWKNRDDDCIVLDLPEAIKKQVIRDYPTERAPTEDDLREIYNQANKEKNEPIVLDETPIEGKRNDFKIPEWLKYDEGEYSHQGNAVRAWITAGYRGTLEMATGSGKTLTSMVAAHFLYREKNPLLIVVAAPYVPLIQQWCDEIALFGVKPLNLTEAGNEAARRKAIQGIKRKLRLGLSTIEILVVSHDTLCTKEFCSEIESIEVARLLIADEAHNLGRPNFIAEPPNFFEYRLALSATPVRQYDPDGTDAVFDFFGKVVFQFTLKDAIGKCLVEYDYFVHPVYLTETEMDTWRELTNKIRENFWRMEDGKPDDYMAKLYRDRRALLETASNKLSLLSRLLDKEDLQNLKHTLIYATDKAPEQLEAVNRLLIGKGVLFHQLTAEETVDRQNMSDLIKSFQRGEIQVLTAKRVLDEGVNIPQITMAYILASTTVERQWVQRRGRLLRICKDINKSYSIVHDFLALPPSLEGLDDDAKNLIKSELRRVQEFASLARNAGKQGGALDVIHPLIKATMM